MEDIGFSSESGNPAIHLAASFRKPANLNWAETFGPDQHELTRPNPHKNALALIIQPIHNLKGTICATISANNLKCHEIPFSQK